MNPNHLAWLFVRHQRNELTSDEQLDLDGWMDATPANRERFNLYTSPEWASGKLAIIDSFDVKSAKRKVLRNIRRQRQPRRIKVIAYTILLVTAVAAPLFFWLSKDHKSENTIVKKEKAARPELNKDSGKVYLTIGGNPTIEVQDAKDGVIIENDSLQVMKKGKLIICNSKGASPSNAVKLATSWASQYQLQLPDSSRVWLNAASSVRYPAEGSAHTRSVQLEGEGYFDIHHDQAAFGVMVNNNTEVEVLGTQFNIYAYPDEERIKTSLVKGKIRIVRGMEKRILMRGQSAIVQPLKPIEVFEDSTIETSIAWKDEFFGFNDASMATIIRQLERWYNVKIKYTDTSHELYNGTIPRNTPLAVVIKMIFKNRLRISNTDGEITLVPVNSKKNLNN